MFIILAASLLFSIPPLFLRWFQSPDAPLSRTLRAFSGGIILGLALIHIAPEAIMEMDELGVEFPVGGVAILGGVLLLVLLDSSLMSLCMAAEGRGSDGAQGPQGRQGRDEEKQQRREEGVGADVEAAGDFLAAAAQPPPPAVAAGLAAAAGVPHTHSCLTTLSTTSLARGGGGSGGGGGGGSGKRAPPRVRQLVTAYTMELGCIFHSVIIGVGIGTITSSRSLVVSLTVAIAVHQGLEALALASVLLLTSFSRAKKVAMLALYAVTTPAGIAIGIAVASAYDPESTLALAVQGSLNGVSAGLLLYISLYQLVGEEFSRDDTLAHPRLLLAMHAALVAGAGVMAVLALWA